MSRLAAALLVTLLAPSLALAASPMTITGSNGTQAVVDNSNRLAISINNGGDVVEGLLTSPADCSVGTTVISCLRQMDADIRGPIVAATPSAATALAANQVLKSSAGTLYSFEVQADSTLAAATWWVMVYNATSAPADGAVTPAKCYRQEAGVYQMGGTFGAGGIALSSGVVIGVSSTGCFTKTASTHAAFIAGDYQ